MEQTKTIFSGEITKQQIIDIQCEAVKIDEKSEQTEVLKETELNEKTDDSVNEEVMEKIVNDE